MTETTDEGRKCDDSEAETPEADLHYVMQEAKLGEGQRAIVHVRGKEIAVMRSGDNLYAVLNFCVHQGGPICRGPRSGTVTSIETDDGWDLDYSDEENIISCPWHGWEFDIRTGEHLAPTEYRIPTYPVVVQDGKIYVTLE